MIFSLVLSLIARKARDLEEQRRQRALAEEAARKRQLEVLIKKCVHKSAKKEVYPDRVSLLLPCFPNIVSPHHCPRSKSFRKRLRREQLRMLRKLKKVCVYVSRFMIGEKSAKHACSVRRRGGGFHVRCERRMNVFHVGEKKRGTYHFVFL